MTDQINHIRPIARNLKPAPLPRKSSEVKRQYDENVIQLNILQKAKIICYENGPFRFYAQLSSSEDVENELKKLQTRLSRCELKSFDSLPSLLGMACIVRHDRKIYRAAVQKFPSTNSATFVCILVDYGYSVSVDNRNLFQIPEELLGPIFAIPLELSGINDGLKVSKKEVSVLFKHLTENRVIKIKVGGMYDYISIRIYFIIRTTFF